MATIREKQIDLKKDAQFIERVKDQWFWQEWPFDALITYVDDDNPVLLTGYETSKSKGVKYPSLVSFFNNK